ncbi:MAG TPA: HIT family protein [Candidatus Baltobacteraceae bacterium]|nr:HIT family protein [Candidatus Baltobacteraceae bacterium]
MECIFCDIGAADGGKFIYRDESVFAILDKFPSSRGHALVITRAHITDMLSATDDLVKSAFTIAREIGNRQKAVLGAETVRITTNIGKAAVQDIFHAHIHVIPFYAKPHSGFVKFQQMKEEEAGELVSLLKIQ